MQEYKQINLQNKIEEYVLCQKTIPYYIKLQPGHRNAFNDRHMTLLTRNSLPLFNNRHSSEFNVLNNYVTITLILLLNCPSCGANCIQGDHSPDTMKFPDNSLTIHGTPDHFNWYSYHACTTSVKVNDQTVKFIFNDKDFIMITS